MIVVLLAPFLQWCLAFLSSSSTTSLSLSLSIGKCSLGFCREIEGGSDKGLFGIVVVLAVQSAFRLKIYQNKVFFIKKIFLILAHQNDLKT